MANRIKSGIKRHRQNLKRGARNMNFRSRLKTLSRNIHSALESKDLAKSQEALKLAISGYDKAASKGIVHKRTASRNISRFSRKVSHLSREIDQASS